MLGSYIANLFECLGLPLANFFVDLVEPATVFLALEHSRYNRAQVFDQLLHVGAQLRAHSCRQADSAWFMRLGKIINVAPVKRACLSRYALLEQLSHQGALAAAARSHDVEVVAFAAHADAELCSIYCTNLTDDLGKVFEFRGSFERKLGGIAAPVKTFRRQWLKVAHCSLLVCL